MFTQLAWLSLSDFVRRILQDIREYYIIIKLYEIFILRKILTQIFQTEINTYFPNIPLPKDFLSLFLSGEDGLFSVC